MLKMLKTNKIKLNQQMSRAVWPRFMLCIVLTMLSACDANPTSRIPTLATQTVRPDLPITVVVPTITPVPPTATPLPVRTVSVNAALPDDLRQLIRSVVEPLKMNGLPVQISDGDAGEAKVGLIKPDQGLALVTRTFAVALPFPSVADTITFESLSRYWQGDPNALSALGASTPMTLFTDASTLRGLTLLLGPSSPQLPVTVVEPSDLVSRTWEARPAGLAILPFDRLEARMKLLIIDGVNLFEREANLAGYPLTLRIGVTGDTTVAKPVADAISQNVTPHDNRDLSKMTIVAMTGVTAMVRGTAMKMEEKGITYPAEAIVDWLRTADITHISNEVSFREGCPPPTIYDGTVMCSNPKYIELLKYVGTDVIELTGNHLWDYGVRYLSDTIKTYKDLGWGYFGGGLDLQDSIRPYTVTVNGNRIAFIGCNWFGADWASDQYAGSAPCGSADPHDFDYIEPQITKLRAEGYLVIATLQYAEFYFYEATYEQQRDFARLRSAGAVVVNGSQGHHVQGFDVSPEGFIHYGTGNLFFGDQNPVGTHQTFVDRHVFYDGHYLGVDLRSAFIVDDAKPVPMNPADRAALLTTLFKASGY